MRKRLGKGKSSIFTAEIHSHNGCFEHWILVAALPGGMLRQGFLYCFSKKTKGIFTFYT
jgi:hypothetical protein